jgi:hypothetical protein
MEGRDLEDIDVGASAGLNRTYQKTFTVDVVDGALDIEAAARENRPMLAMVLATRVGDAPTTMSAPTTSANSAADPAAGNSTSLPASGDSETLTVGPGQRFATLQKALDAAQPGDTVQLATPGVHAGPVHSTRDGAAGRPIVITAVDGARLDCGSPAEGDIARCFELNHSYYTFDHFSIEGGSSNLYMVGAKAGSYVHDVKVVNSTFRGARGGGTGECIRVKYQASKIEIAHNDIADCGLGKCCDGSKNGEGVYIGTAPEQLKEKNPSPEPDATHDVWVHHNVMRPYNECVDIKEAAHDNLVEYNTCSGQKDSDSGGVGSRGGRVGQGNVFRFNMIEKTTGACVRFGGDEEPDGSGNSFYGNLCRDIAGEYGVNQQVEPQGPVCGNRFEGSAPRKKISRTNGVDPTAACPADVSMDGAAHPGAG